MLGKGWSACTHLSVASPRLLASPRSAASSSLSPSSARLLACHGLTPDRFLLVISPSDRPLPAKKAQPALLATPFVCGSFPCTAQTTWIMDYTALQLCPHQQNPWHMHMHTPRACTMHGHRGCGYLGGGWAVWHGSHWWMWCYCADQQGGFLLVVDGVGFTYSQPAILPAAPPASQHPNPVVRGYLCLFRGFAGFCPTTHSLRT